LLQPNALANALELERTVKRIGITAQLFLAVLATAALVALAVGAAAQLSFQRGFIGYLNQQAVLRMVSAMPKLQQAYTAQGSWTFLRDRPEVWFDLIGVGPMHPDATGAPPLGMDRDLMASDLLGAGRRISLLDAQRQRVMGYPVILADSVEREIVVDGRTAGWLVIAPVQTVTDAATLRFLREQWQTNIATGVLALTLAALIAWWVARRLLAPVRTVAAATHRLAAGAYDTRVPVQGQDEVAQLAQDFNQLALTLERNERIRRDYMADVSHELRTPLAVLKGELEAMEDGIHPVTPEGLRVLQAEVGTLTQLVADLHELAMADVGALSYRREDLDLAALLRNEVALLQTHCDERRQTLEARVPDGALWLQADPARMRQLLHNVLGNSVHYTDRGGTIRLTLTETATEAQIDVQDSLPGVPDEMLPRLFERFFRAEGSRNRRSGGSGLGLAICGSIAQAHGGSIEARHSPLGGVWIALRLPKVRQLPSAAPGSAVPAEAAP
jgi:two-component system sensor histidine kinase BaeS